MARKNLIGEIVRELVNNLSATYCEPLDEQKVQFDFENGFVVEDIGIRHDRLNELFRNANSDVRILASRIGRLSLRYDPQLGKILIDVDKICCVAEPNTMRNLTRQAISGISRTVSGLIDSSVDFKHRLQHSGLLGPRTADLLCCGCNESEVQMYPSPPRCGCGWTGASHCAANAPFAACYAPARPAWSEPRAPVCYKAAVAPRAHCSAVAPPEAYPATAQRLFYQPSNFRVQQQAPYEPRLQTAVVHVEQNAERVAAAPSLQAAREAPARARNELVAPQGASAAGEHAETRDCGELPAEDQMLLPNSVSRPQRLKEDRSRVPLSQ